MCKLHRFVTTEVLPYQKQHSNKAGQGNHILSNKIQIPRYLGIYFRSPFENHLCACYDCPQEFLHMYVKSNDSAQFVYFCCLFHTATAFSRHRSSITRSPGCVQIVFGIILIDLRVSCICSCLRPTAKIFMRTVRI
jgi:hypothetical protein